MNLNNPPQPAANPLDAIIEHSEMEKDGNSIEATFACDAGDYIMRIRGNQLPDPCLINWTVDGVPIADHYWTSPHEVSLVNVVLKIPVSIKTNGVHSLRGNLSRLAEINKVWFKKR